MVDLTCCTPEERTFYNNIVLESLKDGVGQFIYPQYIFTESTGKNRRIDFAIITKNSKLAFELDGYTYHAEEKIGQDRFADQLQRQNELILAGWKVIRFSWQQILSTPEHCKDIIRRAVVGDPELHPYLNSQSIKPHIIQTEVLQRLDEARAAGKKRGLVVMATGLGKTFLAAFDAQKFKGKILFVVHNNSILEQARDAFRKVLGDRTSGLYNGYEKDKEKDIVFANISTLRNAEHLKQMSEDEFEYIIIDEFHHGATDNYKSILSYFKPKFMLGLTATPNRTDERSILKLVDNNLIYQITQKEAIDRGFLSPFYYHALKDNVDYRDIRHNGFRYVLSDLNKALIIEKRDDQIIQKYLEITKGAKAIGFCVSIEHAIRSAEHFNSKGIKATAIHSDMSHEKRSQLIREFRDNQFQVCFVRDIFNEGIDFPEVEALLFMRPTESKIIFTQQLGRGLRLSSGKKKVMVLDFIGNYINADKIVHYLEDYGDKVIIDILKKPTYYYDNGCAVEFDTSTIDVITTLNKRAVREDLLIKDFFNICQKMRRLPNLSDIQQYGEYKFNDYITQYGSWDLFLERLKMLDEEIDIEQLRFNRWFNGKNIEEYVDVLDENYDEFEELLTQCIDQLTKLRQGFRPLEFNMSYGNLRSAINRIHKSLIEGDDLFSKLTIILGSRFDTPLKSFNEEPKDIPFDADQITENLKKLTSKRDTHMLPKLFKNLLKESMAFDVLIRQSQSNKELGEIINLQEIYSKGLNIHRGITEIDQSVQAIISSIE